MGNGQGLKWVGWKKVDLMIDGPPGKLLSLLNKLFNGHNKEVRLWSGPDIKNPGGEYVLIEIEVGRKDEWG